MELVPVGDDVTTAAARQLIGEYLSWVAGVAAERHGLAFDIDAMLASDLGDRAKFYPPSGRFYLLRDRARWVGVGALKRLDDTAAEIQRMFVRPPWRGTGAGRLLLERLLDDARAWLQRRAAGEPEEPGAGARAVSLGRLCRGAALRRQQHARLPDRCGARRLSRRRGVHGAAAAAVGAHFSGSMAMRVS